MNKIIDLLDGDFVIKFFNKNLLPLYPSFKKINKIKIIPHKKNIWETTYHVVFEFLVTFTDNENKKITIPIFCSAHSNEPRKNVLTSLEYLWKKGFAKGWLSIPHPLFYSTRFRATFYRGVAGKNLYHYIKKNDRTEIENLIPKTAALFAKLHNTATTDFDDFNKNNSRIKTVNPGFARILERVNQDFPDFFQFYNSYYKLFIKRENAFLKATPKKWLVHGDAHPENIIRMSKRKIALIDFTDLCLADYTRDLGSFTQQLEYMIGRKMHDQEFAEKMSELFIKSYFAKNNKIKSDKSSNDRIKMYYNWTAIRTATHFLLKNNPQPDRALELIEKVKQNYDL